MDRGHRPGSLVNAPAHPSGSACRDVLPPGPRRKPSTAISRRRWMLVPSLLGALVLHACGAESESGTAERESGTADCSPAGTHLRIEAGEPTHEFSTDCLAVPANKRFTIRFRNLDESSHGQHNIEIQDVFKGKTIDGFGESITYKIGPRQARTYKFLCSKHPFMAGTLVVK
jgi:plastocyanin